MLKRSIKKKQPTTTAVIALWYTFASVFAKGIAAISTPIFSRLMSKADFGLFNNFTSWESILLIIVTLDFSASIARAKYDFDDTMNEYMSSILLVSNIVTALVYIIIELNQAAFVRFFSMDIFYIRILFVYLLFFPAFNYLQNKHIIYQKYKFFVLMSISSALIRTLVSVLLVIYMTDKLEGRIIGYIVPITVINMLLWLSIVCKGRKIRWDCVKYACHISIPLIPHALSGILLGSSDRIMITQFCGAEDNAMYSLAYQISLLANILWTSMNQAWAPWLYNRIHENNLESVNRNSKIYLGVYSVLILGIYLITPEIILILGGNQYYDARFVMPPVIMGCVFQFVYGMYVNIEIYSKRTLWISIGTTGAALLNLLLNWICIPIFGYIAAAYTTLAGYAVLMLFHYLIVCFVAKDLKSIYDIRFIILVVGVLIGAGFLSLLLYKTQMIRYSILAVYVIVLMIGTYRNRQLITKLLGLRKNH